MELNITFDYSKCHGMITKGKKDIHQCSAPKKLGEYCGKHANCKTLKTIYDYGAIKTILEVVHHTEIPKEIKIERPLTELEKIGNQLKEYGYNSIGNIECDKKTIELIGKIKEINEKWKIRYNDMKTLVNNESDFLTFTPISDLTEEEIYVYKDPDNFTWGFHIQSISELVKYSNVNPYNTKEIPIIVINEINEYNGYKTMLEEIAKPIEKKEEEVILPKSEWDYIKIDCIEIFQIMDSLDQYTKCDWFLSLQKEQLRTLYKSIEDIWNYRTGLTQTDKNRYVKGGKLFITPFQTVKTLNRYSIMKLLLTDFRKLVSEGETKGERVTGAMWILSALTLVSDDAREAFPWLYQSAYVGN
jgi:hypothetical protein